VQTILGIGFEFRAGPQLDHGLVALIGIELCAVGGHLCKVGVEAFHKIRFAFDLRRFAGNLERGCDEGNVVTNIELIIAANFRKVARADPALTAAIDASMAITTTALHTAMILLLMFSTIRS